MKQLTEQTRFKNYRIEINDLMEIQFKKKNTKKKLITLNRFLDITPSLQQQQQKRNLTIAIK